MIITIDGPSVSGKSTVAHLLAQELDYFYLNTGMLYRGFAYAVVRAQIDEIDVTDQKISDIIDHLSYTSNAQVIMQLNGKDITHYLYLKDIDQAASKISALSIVRKHIDAWQHALADGRNSVIDGRDSGSVVFAHADFKFYVTASDDVRAQRWLKKQSEQGNTYSFDYALEQIRLRDQRDMNRAVSPLVIPKDATIITNDGSEPLAVVEQIKQLCFGI